MAIARNAREERQKYIKSPGEYRVKVIKTEVGLSKKQQRMLTVTFQTSDGCSIKAYYVQEIVFHMKALKLLRGFCGLSESQPSDALVGMEVGISVEPGEERNGRSFMEITGYGPASDVSNNHNRQSDGPPDDFAPPRDYGDNVPF